MSDVKKVTSNLAWRFFERCGAQGISFVISIILARLLDPVVYGTIALVNVFTAILNVFIDSGFGSALIQKKDTDDLDFSTVFYFNITICSLLYIGMFFAAPWIAKFYKAPELTPIVRVMSLTLIISGLRNIQGAYVAKHLLFKKFFFATLGGTLGSAVVGVLMAYNGFGVWSLITQSLFNYTVDTIILWFTVRWRPRWMFSFSRLGHLFNYGWKLLVSALIDTGYANLTQLIIGKVYTKEDLAFYNKGSMFPKLITENINASIDSVLLPTMSACQDEPERVKSMTRRAIKTSTYIMMPMMVGLAACATPMIRLLLTDKWLPCVPFLRIFCFSYAFWPIHTANLNAIKAMGRSDLFLKLEIVKKAVGLTALLSTVWFGVMAMAYSLFFTSICSQIINSWPNKKLLNYSYLEQVKDMLPQIMLSCVMGVIVYSLTFIPIHFAIILPIQVVLGIVIYVFGSMIFKIDSFQYILYIITKFMKNRHSNNESKNKS